jgi:hypothetical protein
MRIEGQEGGGTAPLAGQRQYRHRAPLLARGSRGTEAPCWPEAVGGGQRQATACQVQLMALHRRRHSVSWGATMVS